MSDTKRVRLTTKVAIPGDEDPAVGAVVEVPTDYADMLVKNQQAVEINDLAERDAVTPNGPQVPKDVKPKDESKPKDEPKP